MMINIMPVGKDPNNWTEFVVSIRGSADELDRLASTIIEAKTKSEGLCGTTIMNEAGTPIRVIVDRRGVAPEPEPRN